MANLYSFFINKLPITQIKITIAKILYKMVVLFYGKKLRVISRGGLNYEVDLSEGIDLSLFLFGDFQKHVTHNKFIQLSENAIIFDIGANVGIMSLQFAQSAPKGRVYSFEPTHYAFSRLKKNISLNPGFENIIIPILTFISSENKENSKIKAYSSWKVDGEKSADLHPIHWGTAKNTDGVMSVTLNDFCSKNKIERIDFIKIDTDGHEYEVMQGGKEAIAKYRPQIIFEIGIYMMKEKNIDFSFYYNYFNSLNYKLLDAESGNTIDIANYMKYIPARGTIDMLAIPK